jgi:arylformamidase
VTFIYNQLSSTTNCLVLGMKLYLDATSFIETHDFTDLSIGVASDGVKAWYLDSPKFTPVMENGFVGSIALGGGVNFRNIQFNPHGHGTHTESYGHIAREILPVSTCFNEYLFHAKLVTIAPEVCGEDRIITAAQLMNATSSGPVEALVIRTLPNEIQKLNMEYSNTNPPFMDHSCVEVLNGLGVKHLLVDIPSVDKEVDGGVLAFHHAFWQVPENPLAHRTITELIFVPNHLTDGDYLLELQVANFENDAAPSRPLLYPIKKEA